MADHDNRKPSVWDKLREKLSEWADVLDEALSPPPELVPVPVPVKDRRRR